MPENFLKKFGKYDLGWWSTHVDGVVDISWTTKKEMQRGERMEKEEGDGIRLYVNGDQGNAKTTQFLPAALFETIWPCLLYLLYWSRYGKNSAR